MASSIAVGTPPSSKAIQARRGPWEAIPYLCFGAVNARSHLADLGSERAKLVDCPIAPEGDPARGWQGLDTPSADRMHPWARRSDP